MGQQTGIDIAWARPTIAQIKATGASWVARYFSPDITKNLTASEVTSYTAAGLGVVAVWESTATRALQGFQAGVDDAKAARGQRTAVGLPADMPIHFAVDTDTTWGIVAAYFQGVVSVLGLDQVGVYGGLHVIEGAHGAGIRYLWQTVAWSGGVWAPYATIRQPGGTTLSGGADFDTAETPDFGQYPRPEVDMPLNQADVDLLKAQLLPELVKEVAQGVWSFLISNDAGNLSASTHLGRANVYADLARKSAADVDTKVTGLQTGQVDVNALAAALVLAMGHKLDGTS